MTNPKITRKEAQEAFAEVIDFLRAVESQTVVMPTTAKRAAEVSSILRQCRILAPGELDAETQVKTLREAAKIVAAHRDKYPLSVFPNNLTKHAKVLRENGLAIDRISAENHRQASVALEDELIARADAIEKGE